MERKEKIKKIVFDVIDSINESNPESIPIPNSINTVLFGKDGYLDSLGLVNLIVGIEEKIEESFDQTVTLADENSLSLEASPFRSIETIIDYIDHLIAV